MLLLYEVQLPCIIDKALADEFIPHTAPKRKYKAELAEYDAAQRGKKRAGGVGGRGGGDDDGDGLPEDGSHLEVPNEMTSQGVQRVGNFWPEAIFQNKFKQELHNKDLQTYYHLRTA